MEELSLHILDIAENSIAAGADRLKIFIEEDAGRDVLSIEIEDNGKGMNPETVKRSTDPFFTTKPSGKVGMGLALLKEAAKAANGSLEVSSTQGSGAKVRAVFQLSHVDRQPLGRMADTVTTILSSDSDLELQYTHIRNHKVLVFNTKEIRNQLGDILLNSVEALTLVRNYLEGEESALAQ